MGPPGLAGPEGPMGLVGPKGEQGERGFPGEAGTDGRDGFPGRDGLNGLQGERGPAGKDGRDGVDGVNGKDGKDGIDGAGFDNMEALYDGERTITILFGSGERVKSYTWNIPIPIYRGRWEQSKYARGDEVTFGGQVFRAICETEDKPGPTSKQWAVAANRGRDGRDGKDGATGPQGPAGPPGRDLTQLGPNGNKW